MIGLKLVSKDLAQRLVPPYARVLCIWPGRALAILYLAQYGHSPVGEYRELIIAPAMIRSGGRIGFWISNILVDSERSLIAGRSIWALPKQLASMQWQSGAHVTARVESPQLNVEAVFEPPRRSFRLPFIGTAMSSLGGRQSWFAVRGTARLGMARATVKLDSASGVDELGLSGRRRVLACSRLDITIRVPRYR